MGIIESLIDSKYELSDFRKKKLQYEFRCFYDVNKDGKLQWKDFDIARDDICKLSGWKAGSKKYVQAHELFIDIWRNLQDNADEDIDGAITEDEWLKMWTHLERQAQEDMKKRKEKKENKEDSQINEKSETTDEASEEKDEEIPTDDKVPAWLEKYIVYKFNLYDRTGDGEVDVDEFEYVLSNFKVPPKDCKVAFMMFSMNGDKKVNFRYFRELAIQYYMSDDASDLGNFINGKLSFDEEEK